MWQRLEWRVWWRNCVSCCPLCGRDYNFEDCVSLVIKPDIFYSKIFMYNICISMYNIFIISMYNICIIFVYLCIISMCIDIILSFFLHPLFPSFWPPSPLPFLTTSSLPLSDHLLPSSSSVLVGFMFQTETIVIHSFTFLSVDTIWAQPVAIQTSLPVARHKVTLSMFQQYYLTCNTWFYS